MLTHALLPIQLSRLIIGDALVQAASAPLSGSQESSLRGMGGGPKDIDALKLPFADLAALAFGNLASLPAFDAKTEERRSGAMVNFMLFVVR